MSHKSQRLNWRARCRRWQRAINALLTLAIALAILVATHAPAAAAPRCPGGDATPYGCINVSSGRPAVWPVVWPGVGRTAVTIDPEARP